MLTGRWVLVARRGPVLGPVLGAVLVALAVAAVAAVAALLHRALWLAMVKLLPRIAHTRVVVAAVAVEQRRVSRQVQVQLPKQPL